MGVVQPRSSAKEMPWPAESMGPGTTRWRVVKVVPLCPSRHPSSTSWWAASLAGSSTMWLRAAVVTVLTWALWWFNFANEALGLSAG